MFNLHIFNIKFYQKKNYNNNKKKKYNEFDKIEKQKLLLRKDGRKREAFQGENHNF